MHPAREMSASIANTANDALPVLGVSLGVDAGVVAFDSVAVV